MTMTKNKEMLLIPGPTPVSDEVYEALAGETYAHTDPRFVANYVNALQMTREMFHCRDGQVFVICGSGTLAMEMAIVNTVRPGEKILVLSHGYFGDRFLQIAKAFGIQADTIQSVWGEHVDLAEVKAKLADGHYKAVTVTHVDTSTGVTANLEELVPLVKASGALFILDGVCAAAALEEDMEKAYANQPDYKIDVILTGSQKAIAVPPGLAILAFGAKALAARAAMETIPAYYADLKMWQPVMENPGKYYATPAVNMVNAYEAGMKLVMAEGLPARFARHTKTGKAVRAALSVYGMQALAPEEIAAPTLSCILYPAGVNDAQFRSYLAEKGVVVAGSLASLAGKAFRLGHMGNTTPEMLQKAIVLIGEALQAQGKAVSIGQATAKFTEMMK
ncbi:MAG: alanine--glyoxylate aminotransferase family protein [Negativicutes bacterium]|nr:alanine--glyoxylate aminotransferase family protein [Negativicutes bacterium]